MASVVFLKGVNVGGHKTFRPSVLASKMAKLGVKHLGAAGTFIVSKPIRRADLGVEFRRRLPFATEAMICSGAEILQLASTRFFDGEPGSPNIVRFVSVLAKRPRTLPTLPLSLPVGEDWLVKVIGVQGRFAFGLYRRTLRTIGVLAKLEKHLGGSITTRNWNTFSNLFEMLEARIPQAKKAKLLKAKPLRKGTNISWPRGAWLAIAAGLCLLSLAALAQGLSARSVPEATYSNLVSEAVLKGAQEVSRALTDGGFIPAEQFDHAEVILEGQSARPSARVRASVCEYWFQAGALHGIRRRDLFEDKGPTSLILPHLTNEVLTLTLETANDRALQLLERISYPATRIQELYRISAQEDKMTSYPMRNGGPGFPKDLHFYGELISREKIKITVRMAPLDRSSLSERDRFGASFGIDLLATSGELLEVHFLPEPETLVRLGIHGPEPITIAQTRDFSPPRFVSVTRKVSATEAGSAKVDAAALVRDAWSQLQENLGTNRPKCILICENLNDPGIVVRQMNALAGEILWAGVSHFFNVDLPFEQDRIERVARGKRGICLLAVCGGVETRLEVLADLSPIEPPSAEELAVPGGQEKWKQIYDQECRQLRPPIDDLIQRLSISENLPDHAMFLVSATIPFPFGNILENELPSRLGGKAQVFPVMGESEHWSVGDGVTYGNGKLLTNAIVVFCMSGFLPLQQDNHHLLLLHAASLSNSPSFNPEKLRALQSSPPERIFSGEVINPVREVAYAFGPHPLEDLVGFFGSDQIKMLRAADSLEVFEIKPGRVLSSNATGNSTIEGYEQVGKGKTLGPEAAQQFAAALLTENNGIRAMTSCEWQPAVVFRAWHGGESASLIVCFECNESAFAFRNAARNVVRYTHPFFFSGREVLLRLAREALPSSSKLRSIDRN